MTPAELPKAPEVLAERAAADPDDGRPQCRRRRSRLLVRHRLSAAAEGGALRFLVSDEPATARAAEPLSLRDPVRSAIRRHRHGDGGSRSERAARDAVTGRGRDRASSRGNAAWPRMFADAGLSIDDFEPGDDGPTHLSYRTTACWCGRREHERAVAVSVFGAASKGSPVYFDVAGAPGHRPSRHSVFSSRRSRRSEVVLWLFIIVIFTATAVMVRRNLRAGEGDLRGAWRLAARRHVRRRPERGAARAPRAGSDSGAHARAEHSAAGSLVWGGFSWLSYVAFEPHARRLWPRTLLSWARVLAGRVRDPLVGRDVLVGVLAGVVGCGACRCCAAQVESSAGTRCGWSPSRLDSLRRAATSMVANRLQSSSTRFSTRWAASSCWSSCAWCCGSLARRVALDCGVHSDRVERWFHGRRPLHRCIGGALLGDRAQARTSFRDDDADGGAIADANSTHS